LGTSKNRIFSNDYLHVTIRVVAIACADRCNSSSGLWRSPAPTAATHHQGCGDRLRRPLQFIAVPGCFRTLVLERLF
jgi:hypothetical protein